MCDENKQNNCGCISEILNNIIRLQKNSFQSCCQDGGCDRPFLGPEEIICYNTRPISLYNCTTGAIWGVDGSSIFRLESIDDCCCTCRILNFENGTYTSTNEFFTININCISAVKCYSDAYITF